MKTNNWTPGPWDDGGHDGKESLIIGSQWGEVARVGYQGDYIQRNANARLIALAPEMAEALKRLVGDVDLGEVDYEAPERESLEYARSVLAKLEGES